MMTTRSPHPPYYWWSWWMPLQDKSPGDSIIWSAVKLGIPENRSELLRAHSCLIRAGQAMYNAGLLEHPVRVQTVKGSDGTTFTLSFKEEF